MKLTLAEALEVKRRAEDRLLAVPGVHMVGFGPKTAAGAPTNEFAILVYLLKKKPRESLSSEELIPDEIDGVKTDVIESSVPTFESLEGGIAIDSHQELVGEDVTVPGTLGCFALRLDTNPPKPVLLSNDHVLFGETVRGKPGDLVTVSSCSGCCNKIIAKITRTSGPNDPLIDAAIADLEPGVDWSARINKIPVVGTLDVSPAAVSSLPAVVQQSVTVSRTLIVKKLGRTTGYRLGVLANIAGTTVTRRDQISVAPVRSDAFSAKGDSGSAIYVDNSTDNAANVVQAIFGSPPVKSPDKAMVIGLLWGGGVTTVNGKQIHITSGCHIVPVTSHPQLNIKVAVNSPEVVYRVAGEPRPHPALARIHRDLSGTERVKEMLALYHKYSDEFTNLLQNSRQFVVAWHRNHGPQMVRSLIDVAQHRRPFLPKEIEGQSWANSIEQFEKVLLEVGTPELKADVKKYRSLAMQLGGRSYEEVLGFLVISE
jgi:hypothetical protein